MTHGDLSAMDLYVQVNQQCRQWKCVHTVWTGVLIVTQETHTDTNLQQ